MNRHKKAYSALIQLGARPIIQFALYRLGLRTGYWQRKLNKFQPTELNWETALANLKLLPLPERVELEDILGIEEQEKLRQEAEQVIQGYVRLFSSELTPIQLNPDPPLLHWTSYETGRPPSANHTNDPKFTWEQGRFSFVFPLGRGYLLSGDDRYPRCFWQHVEAFLAANPPYFGPHWVSAQEVALRLVAISWAMRVFAASPESTPHRQSQLFESICAHAERIPPTLIYARSQKNNHLLTEAAGLFTAGILFQGTHPAAEHWRILGWKEFQGGIRHQIAEDGSYCQHSANYHRLMLQISLWMNTLHQSASKQVTNRLEKWPEANLERLRAATGWLASLLDPFSGRVPNLGPNDGAYILPLGNAPFDDYLPVVFASALSFADEEASPASLRSCLSQIKPYQREMALWFSPRKPLAFPKKQFPMTEPAWRLVGKNSWGVLRAVHFTSRPGHADQLHLDLWWQGLNIARDAGTYRYTAEPPWDNALTHAAVHNTVTLDGLDQMTRVSRFLYLDWAQARITAHQKASDGSWVRLSAHHLGYRKLGVIHERNVSLYPAYDHWVVLDHLYKLHQAMSGEDRKWNAGRFLAKQSKEPGNNQVHTVRLHWLLPDWNWKVAGECLELDSPHGIVKLKIHSAASSQASWNLVRGGKQLLGSSSLPQREILGWFSPTYAVKQPALSLVIEVKGELPLSFTSEWLFPDTI
jgi:hypothetical protein